jgi:alpha-mannosidase
MQSELDAGDTYNFSPPPVQHRVRGDRWVVEGADQADGFAELRLSMQISVPAALAANRAGRSDEEVSIAIHLRLRLLSEAARIDCQLSVDNTARDHRLRVLLPLDAEIAETFADSAFEWCRYPVKLAEIPSAPSRREMPVVVNPSLRGIQAGPWIVAHRAMHEYEVVSVTSAATSGEAQDKGTRALALTLLRCVGWMSRRDLVTRGVGAGPDLETPGAQCLGVEVFEFQLGLSDLHSVHPLVEVQRWRLPVQLLRGETGQWRTAMDLGKPVLQMSSLRRVDNALELRLWNPTLSPQSIATDALHGWQRVLADGSPLVQGSGGCEASVSNIVGPAEIATYRRPMAGQSATSA